MFVVEESAPTAVFFPFSGLITKTGRRSVVHGPYFAGVPFAANSYLAKSVWPCTIGVRSPKESTTIMCSLRGKAGIMPRELPE
jgi:hypothetical protein